MLNPTSPWQTTWVGPNGPNKEIRKCNFWDPFATQKSGILCNQNYPLCYRTFNYWQIQSRLIIVGFLQSMNALSLCRFSVNLFWFSHLTEIVDISTVLNRWLSTLLLLGQGPLEFPAMKKACFCFQIILNYLYKLLTSSQFGDLFLHSLWKLEYLFISFIF